MGTSAVHCTSSLQLRTNSHAAMRKTCTHTHTHHTHTCRYTHTSKLACVGLISIKKKTQQNTQQINETAHSDPRSPSSPSPSVSLSLSLSDIKHCNPLLQWKGFPTLSTRSCNRYQLECPCVGSRARSTLCPLSVNPSYNGVDGEWGEKCDFLHIALLHVGGCGRGRVQYSQVSEQRTEREVKDIPLDDNECIDFIFFFLLEC